MIFTKMQLSIRFTHERDIAQGLAVKSTRAVFSTQWRNLDLQGDLPQEGPKSGFYKKALDQERIVGSKWVKSLTGGD